MQSDCAAIPNAVCDTTSDVQGCEVLTCASYFDCVDVTNASCSAATGTCQIVACMSDGDCPAMEACNTWYGYCYNMDNPEGCHAMLCTNQCPCGGASCVNGVCL